MRYKSYTLVSCLTYMHKIQLSHIGHWANCFWECNNHLLANVTYIVYFLWGGPSGTHLKFFVLFNHSLCPFTYALPLATLFCILATYMIEHIYCSNENVPNPNAYASSTFWHLICFFIQRALKDNKCHYDDYLYLLDLLTSISLNLSIV